MSSEPDLLTLHRWRRLDWRFLLPTLAPRRLGYGGAVDPELATTLRLLDPDARPLAEAEPDGCDLAFLVQPTRSDLGQALTRLAPGGWLCLEVVAGRHGRSAPWTVAGWRQTLLRRRLVEVTAYWCPPGLADSTRIVRVDHTTAVNRTLDRHQGVRFGAQKALLGRLLVRMGAFGLAVPQGIVVGRRPGGSR
ncbi:MAG: hypothetical protein ACR2LI_00200 [Propionibacteriaceae bacterium]